MTIQIPNVGTGFPADQTGDSPWLATKKIAENFSNQTHAASREVGESGGNVLQVGAFGLGDMSKKVSFASFETFNEPTGMYSATEVSDSPTGADDTFYYIVNRTNDRHCGVLAMTVHRTSLSEIYYRHQEAGNWRSWAKMYSDKNTTVEDGTNYLKVASPILRLQHDAFVKEHEAEKMDIVVDNPSTGVYKISGTTVLRNDGTWYFSPPKDEHNNVLCMVEVSEENDVITVNTYKKKFDFETVSIIPDYEQPTDIPDGATVMLRFNDLPFDESEISEV